MKTQTLSHHSRLATEIMGMKIFTPEGENIGVIQNMLIDPDKHTLIYIMLCYANFTGKVNRFFAIPSSIMKLDRDGKNGFVLNISPKKLLDAPSLSDDVRLSNMWTSSDTSIREVYVD